MSSFRLRAHGRGLRLAAGLTAIALPAVLPAAEPAAPALTLDACIEKVLAQNPSLQAAACRGDAADALAEQARARPNPRLEAEAENFGGSGARTGWDAAETTVLLSQEIERGGRRNARTAAAAAEAAGARADHESLRHELVRDTRHAFAAVLLAREQLRLAGEALRLAQEIETTTARRIAAGKTTPLEADRVRLETARAGLTQDEAARDLSAAAQTLAALWGDTATDAGRIEGRLEDGPADLPPLEDLLARLERTPDLARAGAAVQAAHARLRAEQAARVSNVEVAGGARRLEEEGDWAFVAGLGVELPLFNRNAGGIRAAAAERDAAEAEAAALRTARALDLRRVHARLRTIEKRIEVLRTAGLPAAERARAAAHTGFREGKLGYLEVLDAQRVFQEMHLEYAGALAERQVTRADLDRLTGAAAPNPNTK